MTRQEQDWENPRVGFFVCFSLFRPQHFQLQRKFSSLRVSGTRGALFFCRTTGGPGHKRAEKTGVEKGTCLDLACYLWELGGLFHALQARARWLILVLCCPYRCSLLGIRLYSVWVRGPGWGDGRVTTTLMIHQILVVFPHSPATVYFSETSNSCSVCSVQVL